jgi:hypothetical protein
VQAGESLKVGFATLTPPYALRRQSDW